MSESQKKSPRKIIYTAVFFIVVIVILALAPSLRSVILSAAGGIWNFLTSASQLPWWLVLVLILLTLPTVWSLFKPRKRRIRRTSAPQVETDSILNLGDYRQDEFFNLVWKWSSLNGNLPSADLWCFCPVCETRLVAQNKKESQQPPRYKVVLYCQTCQAERGVFDGNMLDLVNAAARQLERKIGNGDWKKVVKSYQGY